VDAERRRGRCSVRPRRRPSVIAGQEWSQFTLRGNDTATRVYSCDCLPTFYSAGCTPPLDMRTVSPCWPLRWPARTLGDVAPNDAHCQGQSPGRLSADGLGTLPFCAESRS
jgi:hypothetical protein